MTKTILWETSGGITIIETGTTLNSTTVTLNSTTVNVDGTSIESVVTPVLWANASIDSKVVWEEDDG